MRLNLCYSKLNIFKSVIFFMTFCISFYFICSFCYGTTLQDKKSELENIKSELELKRAKIQDANAREKELSRQIREAQDSLSKCHKNIKEIGKDLKNTEQELKHFKSQLAKKEKIYGKLQKEFENRLQTIYENVDPAYLSAITEAQSFSEFLKTFYYLQIIVEDDFNLLNRLRREKLEIAKKKIAIETSYNHILSLKKELNEKERNLSNIIDKKNYLLSSINNERKQYSARVIQLEDISIEIENQIKGIINSTDYPSSNLYGSSNSMSGNLSFWPSSGPVTSNFGWRIHPIYGDWRFHSGIDIAADYGASINSAGDGVVIYSDWMGGYGYAVMIDHGGGLVSLYAHCSSLMVQCGDYVTKGQTIALVGSTGNSTGPHLHFEVRQGGVSVDPGGFF